MVDKFWYKVARTFAKTGGFPFQINDTLVELLQTLLTEEQAKFVLSFKKQSMNLDELKAETNLTGDVLEATLNELMDAGIIGGAQSRSSGIMVYTLMNLLPGVFEYSFMKGETGVKQKKLADLYEKIFEQMTVATQNNYDGITAQFKKFPPFDRVVPVNEMVEPQQEQIMPYEDVKELINNFNPISVSNCYCRHHKNLLGESCKINAPKLNCIQLGKNATFAITHGFSQEVSKEEALKILKEAEDAGLVHKVIHVNSNPEKIEAAICNCCKCCCETFQLHYRGIGPMHSLTSYIAQVNEEICAGCGTCVEICPAEAPSLVDTVAVIDQDRCIGCGVCAHQCPENAISLKRIGPRAVFIPPLKIKSD